MKTPPQTITLKKLGESLQLSAQDLQCIEAEKKYYSLVVSLKKRRQKMGLTQAQLAQLANLPRTTITKVESGARNTTLLTLMTMAQAMGKNVELRLQ